MPEPGIMVMLGHDGEWTPVALTPDELKVKLDSGEWYGPCQLCDGDGSPYDDGLPSYHLTAKGEGAWAAPHFHP